MMTTKLEIDITKIDELNEAVDFAVANHCPAVVVPSEMIGNVNMRRGMRRGNFKVICAVDWPKGQQAGPHKFRGLDVDALMANGFEVLLTKGNLSQIKQEIDYLTEFVENYMDSNVIELRYVLGHLMDDRDEEYIKNVIDVIKPMRYPAVVRTTHSYKILNRDATIEKHSEILKITKSSRKKVKLSGNIDAKIIANCNADLYGVTVAQAKSILSDSKNLREIEK